MRTVARLAAPAAVVGLLAAVYFVFFGGPGECLVVYCAHDRVYSESILREFEERTGIRVSAKFDTEATKSLGLVRRIEEEKDAPRCDVFWNNELLGTMDLAEKGLLEPYKGPGWRRIPEAFRDPGGRWTGFAARLRVWIVNTDRMDATEEAVRLATAGDLSRVAMANPLFGTTLTHYCVLWDSRGEQMLKAWHAEWRARGVQQVLGNATVKNLVAEGACDLGLTDTDDFFVAKDEGRAVAALPVRLEDGRTIAIPNTVAIVRGSSRIDEARRLVDFLLSAECETALARSKSRQVPLGPVDEAALPEEVRELKEWIGSGYPLSGLGPARKACLEWLD